MAKKIVRIDTAIHKAAKKAALDEDKTLEQYIEEAIRLMLPSRLSKGLPKPCATSA